MSQQERSAAERAQQAREAAAAARRAAAQHAAARRADQAARRREVPARRPPAITPKAGLAFRPAAGTTVDPTRATAPAPRTAVDPSAVVRPAPPAPAVPTARPAPARPSTVQPAAPATTRPTPEPVGAAPAVADRSPSAEDEATTRPARPADGLALPPSPRPAPDATAEPQLDAGAPDPDVEAPPPVAERPADDQQADERGPAPEAVELRDGQRLGLRTGRVTDLPPLPDPPERGTRPEPLHDTGPPAQPAPDAPVDRRAPIVDARADDQAAPEGGLVLPAPPRDEAGNPLPPADTAAADAPTGAAAVSLPTVTIDVDLPTPAEDPDATLSLPEGEVVPDMPGTTSPTTADGPADDPADDLRLPAPPRDADGQPSGQLPDDVLPPGDDIAPPAAEQPADAEPDAAPPTEADAEPDAEPPTEADAEPDAEADAEPRGDATIDLRALDVAGAPRSTAATAEERADRPWVRAYPPGVPETYRYPLVPVTRFLDDAAQDFPDTAAMTFLGSDLSYRQVSEQVDRLGAAFRDMDLAVGERVGVVLPWCPQLVVALHACWRVGLDPVVLDPARSADELADAITTTTPAVLIVLDTLYDGLVQHRERLGSVRHVIATGLLDALPVLRARVQAVRLKVPVVDIPEADGVLAFRAVLDGAPPTATQTELDIETTPALTVVDGTDVVALTHHNVLAGAFQARLWVPDMQAGRERVAVAGDPSDTFAMCAGMTLSVLAAGTLVLPEPRPGGVARAIDAGRPTVLASRVEEVRTVLAPASKRRDLSSLRVTLASGAAFDPAVRTTMEQRTGGRYRHVLSAPRVAGIGVAEPVYADPRPAAAALPVTDAEVRVVTDDGPADRGVGRLEVRGPQVAGDGWTPLGLIGSVDDVGATIAVGPVDAVVTHADGLTDPTVLGTVVRRLPDVTDAVVRTEFLDGAVRLTVDVTATSDAVTPERLTAALRERAPAQSPPGTWDVTVVTPPPAEPPAEPPADASAEAPTDLPDAPDVDGPPPAAAAPAESLPPEEPVEGPPPADQHGDGDDGPR